MIDTAAGSRSPNNPAPRFEAKTLILVFRGVAFNAIFLSSFLYLDAFFIIFLFVVKRFFKKLEQISDMELICFLSR